MNLQCSPFCQFVSAKECTRGLRIFQELSPFSVLFTVFSKCFILVFFNRKPESKVEIWIDNITLDFIFLTSKNFFSISLCTPISPWKSNWTWRSSTAGQIGWNHESLSWSKEEKKLWSGYVPKWEKGPGEQEVLIWYLESRCCQRDLREPPQQLRLR